MIESDEAQVKSLETSIEDDSSTSEEQEARSFLRERFLRVITGVIEPRKWCRELISMAGKSESLSKPASFHMHENTKVQAEFRGCDVNCLEIFARNLETPLGKVPEAILRGTDVICIEIDGIKAKP